MTNNDIKMYILPHWSLIILTIIYMISAGLITALCVLFFKDLWWFIFILILMSIVAIFVIKKEIFIPISINSRRIKYKKNEYVWEDVKVTICQTGTNGYNIIFDTEYATNEIIIKTAYKKHFYTLLKRENLNVILKYLQHKIKIVNGCGEEVDKMIYHPKLQMIVDNFNNSL